MKAIIPLRQENSEGFSISPDFRGAMTVGVFDSSDAGYQTLRIDELIVGHPTLTAALSARHIDAVLASGLRPMALKSFEDAGIACFSTIEGADVWGNLQLFSANKLPRLSFLTMDVGSCAPSSCASCGSGCKG